MKMNLLESVDELLQERPEMSRFLTLTIDPDRYADHAEAHADVGRAWNQLRTELRQEYGSFSYVWVREETDDGWPHLHVLVSRFLPQGEISEAWDRIGAGEIVDIRQVEARKAGNYLAKYLAKDAMANLPSGVHRYGSSADIDLDVRGGSDDDSESAWTIEAYDEVLGMHVDAHRSDFIRRQPDPPPE
jgi:hypothetical protein